jgi:UPF0716 protein FxsA
MWLLLIFGFPVLEIYLLFKVGDRIGLANTFFYLLASAVFGVGLIRAQGAFLMRNLQSSLVQKQMPSKSLMHSLLMFISGAFFIFPGYISDLIGLFFLLPGSRHLVAFTMQKKFAQKVREGSMHFSAGGFGFAGTMRDVSPLEIDSQSSRGFDNEIIDVTPIKPPTKKPE